jgi:hypothetical protein
MWKEGRASCLFSLTYLGHCVRLVIVRDMNASVIVSGLWGRRAHGCLCGRACVVGWWMTTSKNCTRRQTSSPQTAPNTKQHEKKSFAPLACSEH